MVTRVAGFDFALLRSPLGQEWARHLIKADALLEEEDRQWLTWAISTPNAFSAIPGLRDSFLSVVSRSEYAKPTQSTARPVPGLSRFLSEPPPLPYRDHVDQIACAYDALREVAESERAIMRLFSMDEDLVSRIIEAMKAMRYGRACIAALFDMQHGYAILGNGERIGHTVLIQNMKLIFGERIPLLILSTFNGLTAGNRTLLAMQRIYESTCRTKIGDEWYGIVRSMAGVMAPHVEFVSVEDGEVGQAFLEIDSKRETGSRSPIFQYRTVKFVERGERQEELTAQVEFVTRIDIVAKVAQEISEIAVRHDPGARFFIRRPGRKWGEIPFSDPGCPDILIARDSRIELRAKGQNPVLLLREAMDLLETGDKGSGNTESGSFEGGGGADNAVPSYPPPDEALSDTVPLEGVQLMEGATFFAASVPQVIHAL